MPLDESRFADPTGNLEGIDADALLEQIENGGAAEASLSPELAAPPEGQGAPAAPAVDEFTFNWNGKEIKAPREKALQWAQQGYDYAQKMAEFNRRHSEFENIRKEHDQRFSIYQTIDDYAKQNPEWWNQIQQAYQARKQGGSAGDDSSAVPDWVNQKLNQYDQFIHSLKEKEAAQQRASEDSHLDSEIKSIRETYKDLDWDSPNETGMGLEQRVLDHALKNGIQSFRAAFRDYNHEHLVKLAEDRAKENTNKELQKRTKQGLLGQSSTPKKGIQPAEGVKNKSWNELEREALAELGIA
jgi:hypothetical protein